MGIRSLLFDININLQSAKQKNYISNLAAIHCILKCIVSCKIKLNLMLLNMVMLQLI